MKKKFDLKQYDKYSLMARIIKDEYSDDLDAFEQKFIKNISKSLGTLSEKQISILDRICTKFFTVKTN